MKFQDQPSWHFLKLISLIYHFDSIMIDDCIYLLSTILGISSTSPLALDGFVELVIPMLENHTRDLIEFSNKINCLVIRDMKLNVDDVLQKDLSHNLISSISGRGRYNVSGSLYLLLDCSWRRDENERFKIWNPVSRLKTDSIVNMQNLAAKKTFHNMNRST